jgi:hypothetical protein
LGIDLKSERISKWLSDKLEEKTGQRHIDDKFNLGQYNQLLASLIRNKEKENGKQ